MRVGARARGAGLIEAGVVEDKLSGPAAFHLRRIRRSAVAHLLRADRLAPVRARAVAGATIQIRRADDGDRISAVAEWRLGKLAEAHRERRRAANELDGDRNPAESSPSSGRERRNPTRIVQRQRRPARRRSTAASRTAGSNPGESSPNSITIAPDAQRHLRRCRTTAAPAAPAARPAPPDAPRIAAPTSSERSPPPARTPFPIQP